MKTQKFRLAGLRNDEHFQFHTELRDLVNKFGAKTLKVQDLFTAYLAAYSDEDEALKKVAKSALTTDIQDADKRRDLLFRGMVDMSKAYLNHFNPAVQKAASLLKILFDTYGNLAQKPLNEETSAVYNLLQDVNGKYAADAELVNITDWAAELGASNEAFSRLVQDRYEETAAKTDLVLRLCRAKVDDAYRAITERIDALIVVEGEAAYSDFTRRLNAVVDKYNAALSRRQDKGTITATVTAGKLQPKTELKIKKSPVVILSETKYLKRFFAEFTLSEAEVLRMTKGNDL
jgi:hypothetical protein